MIKVVKSWNDGDMRSVAQLEDGRLVLVWNERGGNVIILVPDEEKSGYLKEVVSIDDTDPTTPDGHYFLARWRDLEERGETSKDEEVMPPMMVLLYDAAMHLWRGDNTLVKEI